MHPPDPLDPDRIAANLHTTRIGRKILLYASTTSTNDVAAHYATNPENDGLVVFAEHQTKGRGRAGNKWISPPHQSLLCSILLTRCNLSSDLLSLTTAVAVALTIGHNARIKWPNDILLNGKKTAGILLETTSTPTPQTFIIGIGINCHQKHNDFPPELAHSATSIDLETNTTCDRLSLARRLLTSLDQWLQTAEHDKQQVTTQWHHLSLQLGHRLSLLYNGKTFTGHCIGIDPDKGLILQLDSGAVTMFDAAHTSVLKAT